MKVWCSVDKDGNRAIWTVKPHTVKSGMWNSMEGLLLVDQCRDNVAIDAIFPKGIKPGECKQVTIKRWEVDDG